MEGTCMELALEGERLCKAGDCRTGVQFFESAVQVGTDDLKTLSAIYSQLGNAYFYLQEYGKALEYHKHDLNLARTLGDKLGEAKASGNLGNTLKVLGKFDEAIACCERHLEISRDINDRIGEARALYNLGNVYHAKGKHTGRSAHQDPGEFPLEVKDALQKAAEFYQANLEIVREVSDRAAQGRACGNLGNTHYLLGNFTQAISYHGERLAIAKEFGDKSAERRAYSNLGNAHIFLGEFDVAAEQYKRTLQIAKELGDRALEAQACYSLGNTYTLLKEYETAIEYHVHHLKIAKELKDKVGESRACWSLGNAHTALGHHEEALQYATRHLDISKEIGDQGGQITAQMNLAELNTMLGINDSQQSNDTESSKNTDSSSVSTMSQAGQCEPDLGARRPRMRRGSMENLQLMKLTPDKNNEKKASGGARPKVQKSASVATELPQRMKENKARQPPRPASAGKEKKLSSDMIDDEGFFELLSKFQSRRFDDQRCSFRTDQPAAPTQNGSIPSARGATAAPTQADHEFLDMVAGIQGSRMNDQRAHLPQFPGLQNNPEVISRLMNNQAHGDDQNDQFFEMLMRCQGARIEDQRSSLPQQSAPTVPDEDFFTLVQRMQSSRLDEQRTHLSPQSPTSEDKRPAPSSGKKKKK